MVQRPHLGQQVVRKHRSDRHRDQQRGQRGDDEGDAQRHEQAPLHPRQREQGQEHQHNDHRGVENRRANLHRGPGNDDQGRQPVLRVAGAVLLEPPHDVLHIDHSIVHETADGDRQPTERHGVD